MSFTIVPLKRGFTEISVLYDLAQKHNSVICGGYARYCASPLSNASVCPPSDCDLFPKTKECADELLASLKELGFEVKHENDISYTLQPSKEKADDIAHIPVPQIIRPVIEGSIVTLGTTEEILSNFDFTVVRAAIISPTEVLVDEDFVEDEKARRIRLKNIHCPISSLMRCCKYSRKGYWMRPVESVKLFQDWNARDDDYKVKIIELLKKTDTDMSQEDVDELESLMRID